MSKVIEHKMREVARPTKEVLGEHLYHKISQALSQYEFNPELQLEGRLTGMMLELPTRSVTAMLASERLLRSNISRALLALVKVFPELESIVTVFKEQARMSLTQDDIGSMIYTSVARFEPDMAAKITGMLLELDTATLLGFLNNEDTIFPAAIEKAKRALGCSAQQQQSAFSSAFPLHAEGSAKQEPDESQATFRNGCEEGDIIQAQLGALIFNEALTAHPECAANITGMLLELSVSSLTAIVNDKEKLTRAIDKSYQAWHASSGIPFLPE